MLARPTLLRSTLRTTPLTASLSRPLSSTPARLGTNPVTGGASGSSVGEDKADAEVKNNIWPLFVGLGAAAVGYIGYSNFYSGKEARQEQSQAKGDHTKENPPAGSKPTQGMRG
ncbi:hypothetical protein JCM8547_000937 [Rhodosporidiobolus lusitaniae]